MDWRACQRSTRPYTALISDRAIARRDRHAQTARLVRARGTTAARTRQTLDQEFSIQSAQLDSQNGDARLWPISRVTAWRLVKRVMDVAGVSGRPACPRGLRHSFGVGTVQAGVPITLLQKWMGHARLSWTGIYAAVSGPEEFAMAKKFWDK